MGNTETGADGFASLKDGVYALNVDATKVHPLGSPNVNMSQSSTFVFHRLFGDKDTPTSMPGGSGADFTAIVNSGDNLSFRNAFNKPVGEATNPYSISTATASLIVAITSPFGADSTSTHMESMNSWDLRER